jgi:hypothetical protein
MVHPTGESKNGVLKLDFERRLSVQFRESVVTSDAGLLAYRSRRQPDLPERGKGAKICATSGVIRRIPAYLTE